MDLVGEEGALSNVEEHAELASPSFSPEYVFKGWIMTDGNSEDLFPKIPSQTLTPLLSFEWPRDVKPM